MPRTETATYRSALALPANIQQLLATPAAQLNQDDLIDLATDAAYRDSWDLAGSRDHIAAVCKVVEDLDIAVDAARQRADALETALQAALADRARLAEQVRQLERRRPAFGRVLDVEDTVVMDVEQIGRSA